MSKAVHKEGRPTKQMENYVGDKLALCYIKKMPSF